MSSKFCLFFDCFYFDLWDCVKSFNYLSLSFPSFAFFDFMTSVLKANPFMNWFLSVFAPLKGARRLAGKFQVFVTRGGACFKWRYLTWFSKELFWRSRWSVFPSFRDCSLLFCIGLYLSCAYYSKKVLFYGCTISYLEWLDHGRIPPSLTQCFPPVLGFDVGFYWAKGSDYLILFIISWLFRTPF